MIKKVILASASPRRLELLRQIGVEPTVCPADFEESGGQASEAVEVVCHNALGKCRAVAKLKGETIPVIGADTVVVVDNVILGKPVDVQEAKAMLRKLSGRVHEVLTGIAIKYKGQELAEVVHTKVYFRELSATDIDTYVATGEPLDKAGAYGIQGMGAVLVKKIDGCYNNVVGLPLTRVYEILAELGAE